MAMAKGGLIWEPDLSPLGGRGNTGFPQTTNVAFGVKGTFTLKDLP